MMRSSSFARPFGGRHRRSRCRGCSDPDSAARRYRSPWEAAEVAAERLQLAEGARLWERRRPRHSYRPGTGRLQAAAWPPRLDSNCSPAKAPAEEADEAARAAVSSALAQAAAEAARVAGLRRCGSHDLSAIKLSNRGERRSRALSRCGGAACISLAQVAAEKELQVLCHQNKTHQHFAQLHSPLSPRHRGGRAGATSAGCRGKGG